MDSCGRRDGRGRARKRWRSTCRVERGRRWAIAGTHVEVLANFHPRRGQGGGVALERDGTARGAARNRPRDVGSAMVAVCRRVGSPKRAGAENSSVFRRHTKHFSFFPKALAQTHFVGRGTADRAVPPAASRRGDRHARPERPVHGRGGAPGTGPRRVVPSVRALVQSPRRCRCRGSGDDAARARERVPRPRVRPAGGRAARRRGIARARARLVTFDMRAHGASTPPASANRHAAVGRFADDVLAAARAIREGFPTIG